MWNDICCHYGNSSYDTSYEIVKRFVMDDGWVHHWSKSYLSFLLVHIWFTPSEGSKGFVNWIFKKSDHGSWTVKSDHGIKPFSMLWLYGPWCKLALSDHIRLSFKRKQIPHSLIDPFNEEIRFLDYGRNSLPKANSHGVPSPKSHSC